jgi:hypothetical protein
LQVGYPYSAHVTVFSGGVDLGLGDWRARPYYRRVTSQSEAILLPGSVPSLTDDSRLDLVQDAYGLHVELPSWWQNTALGLGWERQVWTDLLRPVNDGQVDFYMIDFSARY